jgi:hypothetical protein
MRVRGKQLLAMMVVVLLLAASGIVISADTTPETENPLAVQTSTVTTTPPWWRDDKGPWWIGDLLTVLGIIVGALMIVFQLGRQQRHESAMQKDNFREQLRLEIYQEFSKVLVEASDKMAKVSSYVRLIDTLAKVYFDQANAGVTPTPISPRSPEFTAKHYEATNSNIELIELCEKYQIVSSELYIFRLAIHDGFHNLEEAFRPLNSFLVKFLPMDYVDNLGNSQILNVNVITSDQIDILSNLVDTYTNAAGDLSGYLFDLNVELQNIFLSGLFKNKVKRREPIDKNIKVITTDPDGMEKLKKYFEEESPSAIHRKQVARRLG